MIYYEDVEGRKDLLMDFDMTPTQEIKLDMARIMRHLVFLAEYCKFTRNSESKFNLLVKIPIEIHQQYFFNENGIEVHRNPYSIHDRKIDSVTYIEEATLLLEEIKRKAILVAKEEVLTKLATARIESLLHGKD